MKRETDIDSLLVAIRDKDQARVPVLIQRLKGTSAVKAPARDDVALGKWKLLWTEEGKKSNPLQKALIGKVGSPHTSHSERSVGFPAWLLLPTRVL